MKTKITQKKDFGIIDNILFCGNVSYSFGSYREKGLRIETLEVVYHLRFVNYLVLDFNTFNDFIKSEINYIKSIKYIDNSKLEIKCGRGYFNLTNYIFDLDIRDYDKKAYIEVTTEKNKTWSYFRKEANKNIKLLELRLNNLYKNTKVAFVYDTVISKSKIGYNKALSFKSGALSLYFLLNKENKVQITYSNLNNDIYDTVIINKNNQEIRDFQENVKNTGALQEVNELIEYARQLFF